MPIWWDNGYISMTFEQVSVSVKCSVPVESLGESYSCSLSLMETRASLRRTAFVTFRAVWPCGVWVRDKVWQKTKLSKVIQNCIGFSALRSMIGLWNSRHPPDQSDPALKSITPGSPSISRVFQRLSEVVQKSIQFLIDSNYVGVLSKPKFLQVDTHFTFCDGFYRKTCWFRRYNHSVFPN